MSAAGLGGILPALVTPFRDDESIDYAAWQRLIETLIAAGVHGLFVIGEQGEFCRLTPEERTVAMRFCAQTAARRVPVIANVGAETTAESVRLAQGAETDGIDYVAVTPPHCIQPSADELVEHYSEVCGNVRIPVLACNSSRRTCAEVSPAMCKVLMAGNDNFVGVEDSSGDADLIREFIASGLMVFGGRDEKILPALKLGCIGVATTCAIIVPRLVLDVYNEYRAGNLEEAARLQALVDLLHNSLGRAADPVGVKEAMDICGQAVGRCRRPAGPLPEEVLSRLAVALAKLREEDYLPEIRAGAAAGD